MENTETTVATATPNINGVTLKDVTRMMNNIEKILAFYNKKYNFDMDKAKPKEQKEFKCLTERWDFMKVKRDELKSITNGTK